jgi:hypothetical protein
VLPQDGAHRGVGLAQELAGALLSEGARQVADPLLPFRVEVLHAAGQRKAVGALLGDAVDTAVPQGRAVGGERQHPERALRRLGGDEVAGEEGVGEHHALGHGPGERPHLVLAGSGEDRQAVLGVRQIDLGQGLVEVPDDLGPPFAADRRIGLQLPFGLGHRVAQPDLVLGLVGIAPVGRRQHGDRGVGARAPQLGKGRGTHNVLHDRTIEPILHWGIWGNRPTGSVERGSGRAVPAGSGSSDIARAKCG